MEKKERRKEDIGPKGRHADIKTILLVIALLANVGAVLWKGGQISNQFDSLLKTVDMMTVQISTVLVNQSDATTERAVQGERITNNATQIEKHDRRLNAIEQTPAIKDWRR